MESSDLGKDFSGMLRYTLIYLMLHILFRKTEDVEHFSYLTCSINQSIYLRLAWEDSLFADTQTMLEGLKLSLTEHRNDDEECSQRPQCQIVAAPKYLLVNFTRFFWKSKEAVQAKILKVQSFYISILVNNLYRRCPFPWLLTSAQSLAFPILLAMNCAVLWPTLGELRIQATILHGLGTMETGNFGGKWTMPW